MATMTRIAAYQPPPKQYMTQHQMKNIGIGSEPNAPLRYIADVYFPGRIGTEKVRVYATSQIEAEQIITEGIPKYAHIHTLRIL